MISTNLKYAQAETRLARRLAGLIKSPGISWFFESHPEFEWLDFSAREAWECWIRKELTKEEFELYEELYGLKFSEMDALRESILIDTNRIPQPDNVDGY